MLHFLGSFSSDIMAVNGLICSNCVQTNTPDEVWWTFSKLVCFNRVDQYISYFNDVLKTDLFWLYISARLSYNGSYDLFCEAD